MADESAYAPGPIILFGSGETLPPSGKAHEYVAERIGKNRKIVILETPAGFEPNSSAVAGNVGRFIGKRLQNFQLDIQVLPARKKGTEFSTDNQDLLAEMLDANWLFMGPGSPTYAVRQLENSLAWEYLTAQHRLGVPISLASAAVLAVSVQTLPVYEIYKVGEDLHWKPGLNLLGNYGLDCIFIPHWNNSDGGQDLDTSRCYMGQERFDRLKSLLALPYPIVGIDEHTALIVDFENDCGCVLGNGSVTILTGDKEQRVVSGETFSLHLLGEYRIPQVESLVSAEMMEKLRAAGGPAASQQTPGESVTALVQQRETARQNKDWAAADRLREEIESAGWELRDTPDGPELYPKSEQLTA